MIDRIARSLTIAPRWQGNLAHEYYVSDHLLIGLEWIKRANWGVEYERAWVLHDAPEYLIGDLNTPEKKNLPDYNARERVILEDLCNQFDVPTWRVLSPVVKICDREMVCAENVIVHFDNDESLEVPDSALVDLIKDRILAAKPWADRQAEFKRVWRDLFERVTA